MLKTFKGSLLRTVPVFMLLFSSAFSNQCGIPRVEQEFCNSFHSVCLSTPDKMCLAQSMINCIDYTGFPVDVIASLNNFLVEFMQQITIISVEEVEYNLTTPLPTTTTTTTTTTTPTPIPFTVPPMPQISVQPTETAGHIIEITDIELPSIEYIVPQMNFSLPLISLPSPLTNPNNSFGSEDSKAPSLSSPVTAPSMPSFQLPYIAPKNPTASNTYQISPPTISVIPSITEPSKPVSVPDFSYGTGGQNPLLIFTNQNYPFTSSDSKPAALSQPSNNFPTFVFETNGGNTYQPIQPQKQIPTIHYGASQPSIQSPSTGSVFTYSVSPPQSISPVSSVGSYSSVPISPSQSNTHVTTLGSYSPVPFVPETLPPLPPAPITLVYPDGAIGTSPSTTELPSNVGMYTSGHFYVDYLIGLLNSVPEQQIQNVVRFMIEERQPISPLAQIDWETEGKAIDLLLEKLNYLITTYTAQHIPDQTLKYMLEQVFGYSVDLFQWLVMVVDEIVSSLNIEMDTSGTSGQAISNTGNSFYSSFSSDYYWRRHIKYCHPNEEESFCERYCSDYYGGNWIGIQARERHTSSYQSFDKSFEEYAIGFGNWKDGYWMGLNCLHSITKSGAHELLIELSDAAGNTAIAHYDLIFVEDLQNNFKLQIGSFLGGSAGDSFTNVQGANFTTRDYDNDQSMGNCAIKHQGGWWYNTCQQNDITNVLNGYFSTGADLSASFQQQGVMWDSWQTEYVIASTRMFIRRRFGDN